MSMMMSTDTRQRQPNHPTPEPLSSGFLMSPFPYEGRRDSLASTQSSYCQSFASSDYSGTDFSIPVTPTCDRSPLPHNGFVDVMSYEQSLPMHGLTLAPRQKESLHGDNPYESFVMIPSATMAHTPYSFTDMPTSRMLGQGFHQFGGEDGFEAVHMPSENQTWDGVQTDTWAGYKDRLNELSVDNRRRCPQTLDELQIPWNEMIPGPLGTMVTLPTETIVPTDALMEDLAQVHAGVLDSSVPVGGDVTSFIQSPQQVSFRRSESPVVKTESDVEQSPSRLENRMYFRSTGAKGVKEERGISPRVTKKKAKRVKVRYQMPSRSEVIVDLEEKGGYACAECGQAFKRPEHRKRHQKSHLKGSAAIEAYCTIEGCLSGFNRNDNCIAHYECHILKPGKKQGRKVSKMPLDEVLMQIPSEKVKEKLRRKYPHLLKNELAGIKSKL